MYIAKCCISGCGNRGKNAFFHNIPIRDDEKRTKWLDCINNEDLKTLPMEKLKRRTVCHIHFEKRFIKPSNRLRYCAYPSLFTPEEISSGVPKVAIQEVSHRDPEFCYKFKHYDHNYAKGNKPCEFKYLSEYIVDCNDGKPTDTLPRVDTKEEFHKDEVPQEEYLEDEILEEEFLEDEVLEEEYLEDEVPEEEFHVDEVPQEEFHKDEVPKELIFSWQKDDAVVPCDDGLEYMEVDVKNEPKKESLDIKSAEVSPVHVNICCNACHKEIVGFRYVCVQCPDYDLCAACEARGLHHTHYVLRVPGPRPQSEVQEMLHTIRRVLSQSIVHLGVPADETVIKIEDEEEDPLVEELPPPSPSLWHEHDGDPNYTRDAFNYMSDASDDLSNAPTTKPEAGTTEPANPLKIPTSSGPTHYFDKKKDGDMELSKNAIYSSDINKGKLKIIDPNQFLQDNTKAFKTDEESPATDTAPTHEKDHIIDIKVIHSEPIEPTSSSETVPPLDMEFLTYLVLKIPEVVNASKCEYVLHMTHMNCNYYIQVKKKIRGDINEQLREEYCGNKIAYVQLTRLTQEEISAATNKQNRTCTQFTRKQNTAKRKTP